MKKTTVLALMVIFIAGLGAAQDMADADEDGVLPGAEPAVPVVEGEPGELPQATLLAVGWSMCPVGTLDTATGAWTSLGNAGFDECNSLARNTSEVFYTVADTRGGFALVTVDPGTGAGTAVAPLTPQLSVRALAFSPSDELYAVADASPEDQLWIIDTATGNATLVGNMGYSQVQGMAFDFLGGTLYATDNTLGLLTVDPATGAATDVGAAGGTADVQTITVLPTGEIIGIRYDVYSIDPVTGVYSFVATGGYPDFRGADFVGPIPVELMGFDVE